MTAGKTSGSALAQAERIARLGEAMSIAAQELCTALSSGVEEGVNASVAGLNRRRHRGNTSKLATDTELAAFVMERAATMTFAEVVKAVAKAFPPERHISQSSLHRWWHRTGKHAIRARANQL